MTSGYVDNVVARTPAGTPEPLVAALRDPDVLIAPPALEALTQTATSIPGGEQTVENLLQIARTAMAGAIRGGFLFIVVAAALAVAAALMMPNLLLEEMPTMRPVPEPGAAEGTAAALSASAASR